MKINAAFLARLRDLKRSARAYSLPSLKNPLSDLNFPAADGTGGNGQLSIPPVPAFVTDLLHKLGVPTPDAVTARKPGAVPDTNDAPATGRPGEFITRAFACDAGTRNYRLYIPSAYSGKPLPLLLMLHGCSQTPDDFATGTRANCVADELGCFVVYPAQTSAANISKCWNWFQPGDQQTGTGEPAILAGIVRQIMVEYAIDETRVFVAGLSAGGAMAAIMGATYPDLFAAVGVHSGVPVGVADDLQSALAAMRDGGKRSGLTANARNDGTFLPPPMIIFQGDADKTVHPRNADALMAQCIAGRLSQTVEEFGKADTAHAGSRTYTRTLVLDAEGKSLAEQWIIHHAGHAWSGGDAAGSYTDPKGPDATREMLAFFFAHPKQAGLMQRLGNALPFLQNE